MAIRADAACLCVTGRVRKNNEDNFLFAGQHLEKGNSGLNAPLRFHGRVHRGAWFAVLDGMGGERFGDDASHAAAVQLAAEKYGLRELLRPAEDLLAQAVERLNRAVVDEANTLATAHMGSTLAALYFDGKAAWSCNLGDSPVFLLRDGGLVQISKDHVSSRPTRGKPALTQHLGIDPEEMAVEPHLARQELQSGDVFLICSDGITDMVPRPRIQQLLTGAADPAAAVTALVDCAMEAGGRDNATALVIRIL